MKLEGIGCDQCGNTIKASASRYYLTMRPTVASDLHVEPGEFCKLGCLRKYTVTMDRESAKIRKVEREAKKAEAEKVKAAAATAEKPKKNGKK